MGIGIHTVGPSDPMTAVWREISGLKQLVRELAAARTLQNATIDGGAGAGIRTADFDGTSFAAPGTAGNYFGADGAVLNSLYLRPGSVSNDALTNPVTTGYYEGSAGGTLTVAGSFLHTGSIVVPPGFTQAIVHTTVSVGGTNNCGVPDNIYVRPAISGISGQVIANSADVGYAQSVTMAQATVLIGLTGGVIQVQVWGAIDTAGWTGGNGHISAMALFVR